jgi:non-canonical poly(A) RNA polymerase PAPD5/7
MSFGKPSNLQLESKDERGTNRKHREDRDQGPDDAAAAQPAGPSNVSAAATKPKGRSKGKGSGSATPVLQGQPKFPMAFEESSFEDNGDFIAFGSIHDDHGSEEKEDTRVRDWDKGKGKASERDGGVGKRRRADFDRNDGYSNKKERTNAASRKAPWVNYVDWEGSANVADLYASFFLDPDGEGTWLGDD